MYVIHVMDCDKVMTLEWLLAYEVFFFLDKCNFSLLRKLVLKIKNSKVFYNFKI